MSHLQPTRSVSIRPGGSGIEGTRRAYGDVDDLLPELEEWGTRVERLADELAVEDPDAREAFAVRLDEAVDAAALLHGLDVEVVRTKVLGALRGVHGMVEDLGVLIDDDVLADAMAPWDIDEPGAGDLALARLAVIHTQISTLAGAQQVVGQVGYTLDAVPDKAEDAAKWIRDGDTDDDRRARAQAAQEVEAGRSKQRSTVTDAIAGVLGG